MKNIFGILFLILLGITSLKSQNYFQLGTTIGFGLNFNHMQKNDISPYQTKNELVASCYFDISYRLSKKMYFETNIGIQEISAFIERNSSKIGANNIYSNSNFGQYITNVPLYINYEVLSIKNKYSLRGLLGVNNLFPTEHYWYVQTNVSPYATLYDTSVYHMPPDYSICLVGGIAFEKRNQNGNRLGLKLIYQQGFKEIAFWDVYYSFNSQLLDKTTRSYNKGSQLNLCIYYYWGPLGKKYRIIKAPKTGNNGLTQ